MRLPAWMLRLSIVSLFASLIVPSAVAPPARPVEAEHEAYTNNIAPAGMMWSASTTRSDNADLPTNAACSSPGTTPSDGPGAVVGFLHTRITDDATGGFAQDCRNDFFSRTRLWFDVTEFKKHPLAEGPPVYAWLTYDEQRTQSGAMPRGSQGITCVKDMHLALSSTQVHPQGPGSSFPRGEEIFRTPLTHDGPPLNSDPWDLSDAVKGWMDGSIPNHGVVLSGYDESAENVDDADCLGRLSNVTLKVIVFWEVAAVDLSVRNIVVADKTAGPGCVTGTVFVGVLAENTGDVAVGGLVLMLRVDGIDRQSISANGLAPGAITAHQFDNIDMSAGVHKLEVIVDPDGELAEYDEVNNVATDTISCASGPAPTPTPAPSDLSISKLEIQQNGGVVKCVAGSQNSVMIIVKNSGDKDISTVFNVQVNVDGKPAGTASVGGMTPRSEKTSFVSNVNIPLGTHTVQAILDPENKIAEGGEQNNNMSIQVTCTQN